MTSSSGVVGWLQFATRTNQSMVQDPEIARDNLVLEYGIVRDVDELAVVRYDYDCPFEGDSTSESHVSWDRQMVELKDVRNGRETPKVFAHLYTNKRMPHIK